VRIKEFLLFRKPTDGKKSLNCIMKKLILLAFVGLLFSFVMKNIGDHKLKAYKVSTKSNAVELLIPEGLSQLSNEDAIGTYGMARTPMAIFADEMKDVSIIVSVKPLATGNVEDLDLKLEMQFKKSALLSSFTTLNSIKEEVTEINGFKAIVFEFDSEISGKDGKGEPVSSKNYNYVAYLYKKDREYSVNFNTPATLKEEWKSDASLIINSIKVK
jgi:hypothetical protein